jgi:HSP20 family molecular chaperone IbpA
LNARVTSGEDFDTAFFYLKKRLKPKDVGHQRYFVPSDEFDREKTEARLRNGILKVVIPPRMRMQAEGGVPVRILKEGDRSD